MPDASAETVRLALNAPQRLPLQAAEVVQQVGLGGWVWGQLPAGHPLKAALARQRFSFLARHMKVRAELLPLLNLWQAHGIAFMLLKGFLHAELTYPDPAQRFYGDVDILIHEADALRAEGLAAALGWRSDGLAREARQWSHEVAHLYSPGGNVRLDVHRDVTARWPLSARKVRRATQAFWRGAQWRAWHGLSVQVPDPVDQLLHLALTRAWSGDAAHLKPADVLDAQLLQRRHALGQAEVRRRAAELGCLHTWQAFSVTLEDAACGNVRAALGVKRRTLLDGHSLTFGQWARRALEFPAIVQDALKALPTARAVKRELRGRAPGSDVRLLAAANLGAAQRAAHETALRSKRGVRWALKLLYFPREATCLPRSLTLYRVLTAAGQPVALVSGVRRNVGSIEGHAWVEWPGVLNATYGEPETAALYHEVFRCKPSA